MLKIGDIVHLDEEAEFRSDVQLSAYDDPASNIALLRSYMFSSTARMDDRSATPSRSPVEILDTLVQVYSSERLDNRLVVIANYGHGKSHLALALANYFGKPAGSPEQAIILEKLNYALGNPAKVSRYRTFKESRGRFMVIRLRGDIRRSLREQFVVGLEQALNEYPETKGTQLPFWFSQAEAFLKALNGGYRQQADDYLAQFGTDVPLLLDEVQKKNESVHQRCIDLFKHLYHVTPNFGGDIALKDAMAWATKEFCGPDKPFGGVLVLFDEFSLYVLNYAYRSAPGELQDLLNGVDDHRGQVAFLAFAQHDPIQVAREAYQRGQQSQTQQESLERELTRLQKKFTLYSVLESVINSYLIQPEETWQKFSQEKRVRGNLFRATDVTLETFRRRYEDDLNWATEEVQETMTKGCFPLHPLTTALLCNLQFQESAAHLGTARTVLGFVREELKYRRDLPAVEDGDNTKINWALPICLVNYFGETLSESHFQQYQNARQTIGEEITTNQEAALKALLLQEVANLPNRGSQQTDLLAELAGLKAADLKTVLKELREAQAILFNSLQRKYTFWSVGNDPRKLDRILSQHLKGRFVDWSTLSAASQDSLESVKIGVNWGHPQDWEAPAYFLTKGFFTVSHLQQLCPKFTYDPRKGLGEGARGCVLWLLAHNQDEIAWFKEEAAQIMDQAFPGESPLPVVAVIPSQPCPELLDAWLRKKGLEAFSQDERKEVGLELHSIQLLRTKEAIGEELQRLKIGGKFERLPRPNHYYLVPLAYRTAIRTSTEITLIQAMERSYNLAYRLAPPEFFTQYKLNSTNLKNAVKHIANLLRQNSVIDPQQLPQGITRDLGQKILRDKWYLLTTGGHIREPENARLKQAWTLLDKTFEAGKERPIRDALVPLFNTPYGYDYHTATLMLCAWYGYNKHDLQLTANGQRVSGERLDEWLTKDSRDFVHRICHSQNAALQRRDRVQIDEEAREHIERASQALSQAEAEMILHWLTEYCRDDGGNQALQAQAKKAAERLQSALEAAEAYDRAVREISDYIETGQRNLSALISLQHKIAGLPAIDNVRRTGASANTLRSNWLESVEQAVDKRCLELENLPSVTQVGLHKQKLVDLKDELKRANLSGALIARVDDALSAIDDKARELQALEQEAGIQSAISAMESSASLQVLYSYLDQLQKMKGYSKVTMGMRDEKLKVIQDEITHLEQMGQELPEAVGRLHSTNAVWEWRRSCLRLQERFVGTPYYEKLAAAEARTMALRDFFQELESIRAMSFKTPQEAQQIRTRLTNLLNENTNHLSVEQQALVSQLDRALTHQISSRINQADQWLVSLEQEWRSNPEPAVISLKIDQPPAFLKPESRSRLHQLKTAVQSKLDEDAIAAVEMKFRQITDADRRQKCLERLKQVNMELTGELT